MFAGVPQRHRRLYGDERSLRKVLHLGDAPRLTPLLLIASLLIAASALAQTTTQSATQTTTRKSATTSHPRTSGPTNVSGAPVSTASGLQYWNIKLGTGALAIPGKKAKVRYTGWLTTGKKFDSGVYDFVIGNGQVIKGWDEGVAGMKVGAKRQLRIPPQLAYGARGYPGAIPPHATLIFDVELLGAE
jgi:FKBP-type peptidyl-prolyl cis-trans isomerase